MFKTVEAERFFAAWQALRQDQGIPHYRTLFQDLPKDLIPQLMIYELVAPEGVAPGTKAAQAQVRVVVRFMGTRFVEFWNQDLTGQDPSDQLAPKLAVAGRRNFATMLAQPCGFLSVGLYSMTARDDLAMESVWLPVGYDPGRPPRILNFGQELRPPFALDDDRPDTVRRRWLDIGFGVPRREPVQ